MACPYWRCLLGSGGGGVYTIAQMGWGNFYSHPNGQFLISGGVRALARMVYTFSSSFWQCQRPDEKKGGLGLKLFGQ